MKTKRRPKLPDYNQLHRDLIAALERQFGKRNHTQKDSDVQEAFDHAIEYLRERWLALPRPGESRSNCTNIIRLAVLDDKGMEVEIHELNETGRGDILYQAHELMGQVKHARSAGWHEEESE